ncbi:hypothetical protein BPA_0900007 [Borrelia parkeri SLO]|uniref:Transposase n=1 Tax=Borrelia parkeri SLO TaxID=1313294 RepID=A0ABM5PK32_BORPR|nr:hypothetical protein BPA_0900007 [Borrelia parkeri SLO]
MQIDESCLRDFGKKRILKTVYKFGGLKYING